jgi:hypothetical protein
MSVRPRSPTVLNGTLPMRTGCGSVLTAALNVDRLNLIQSQAAKGTRSRRANRADITSMHVAPGGLAVVGKVRLLSR